MLWRQQFKTLFVQRPRKNILLVKGAKVSFASTIQNYHYFFCFTVCHANPDFV
jgi:hypothetical protein